MATGKRGAGRAPQKRKQARRKAGTGEKLLLASVTFLNLLLSLVLALLRRREIVRAVQEDDKVKLLLTSRRKNEN